MATVNKKGDGGVPAKKKRLQKGGFDLPFFVLVMIILMIGQVMMYSASCAYAYYK